MRAPAGRERRSDYTRHAPERSLLYALVAAVPGFHGPHRRGGRRRTRHGWLEGEDESAFLSDRVAGDDGMDGLRMSSITYRIATGAQAGRTVVTLQTLPGDVGPIEGDAGKVGGFSLHAGVAAEAHESVKLERLCRDIARPAIAERRLSLSPQGRGALPAQDASASSPAIDEHPLELPNQQKL